MTRQILHISDPHFGRHNRRLEAVLLADITRHKPDLLVISGDFTQVGNDSEFRQAQQFIKSVNCPVFTVPGNHDIPRFKLSQRLLRPYERYCRYINPDLYPVYEDDDMIVAGISTTRRILPHWNWAHGMISDRQMAFVSDRFQKAPPSRKRVFVCHHPLQEAAGTPLRTIVWGREKALARLMELKIDLALTGHVHFASHAVVENEAHRLTLAGASTALSTRLRDQGNGYNLITLTDEATDIRTMSLGGDAYIETQHYSVKRHAALSGDVESRIEKA